MTVEQPQLGHYLDHASTSPLRPEARAAMIEALGSPLGDPSRIHEPGMTARVVLEQAREVVAGFLGARPREVVFTSGASESIAAVCWGVAERGPAQHVSGAVTTGDAIGEVAASTLDQHEVERRGSTGDVGDQPVADAVVIDSGNVGRRHAPTLPARRAVLSARPTDRDDLRPIHVRHLHHGR